ncbi:copper resistance protein B [Brevundimonas diminuta]|uniref:copper resistance protein B n=1 Tax=Brevundimonas diminuta TaxID=293 RepID=UPI002097791F|nr:copper resistance protein B [Brevundimonas diminuta]MCO8019217.1 copper resistance protein B [Brevundimonas diminuta]MCO8021894.1 copper resistance protein B [Brevundimonas diminuta]
MKPLSLSLALAPLMLAAGGPALAQSHAGHAGHAPAAAPAPAAQTTPPAAEPAHDCPMMRAGKTCPMHGAAAGAQADPHAGHDMNSHAGHSAAQADPHAGHAMTPAQAEPADPHAGHDMSSHAGHGVAQTDPHAGHAMTPAQAAPADPHAGHDMSSHAGHGAAQTDPHAGHDMSVARGGPNIPTSVDAVGGRLVETPPPAAARAAPAHAADLLYDPAVMAAARKQLLAENGDIRSTAVFIDSLEAGFGDGADTYGWSAQGWTGGDINRFWWKTEGQGEFDGKLHEVEVQALYSRAIAPFWDVQAGVRQDFRPDGKDTTHLTVGLIGVAPYWFEIGAAAFLSTEGDLTARVEAEYDQRLTQKWILQPALELALSASDIPELETGSGLTSVTAGLRLRYEVRKEFAPYVGVEWSRSLGDTADYAKARGADPEDTRFVVGVKAWF